MAKAELNAAKTARKDEFYTQFVDIQKEMNTYLEFDKDVFRDKTVLLPCDDPEWSNFTKYFAQNFETLGLKKLISTSFLPSLRTLREQPSLFETESSLYDSKLSRRSGKIFVLSSDINNDNKIDVNDLEWSYLAGDGDFRSKEVEQLRDESDIIVTNPPFSLFREFLAWIGATNKKFAILGNVNAITYKVVFPQIKANKMWLGPTISSGDREFQVPNSYPLEAAGTRVDEDGKRFIRVKGVRWFTNLDHGRRHQPLVLMTKADNKKFSKHKEVKGIGYKKYDNYDAIEIPFTDAIPSDHLGIMGVPITFLDKYSPEQFEILGATQRGCHDAVPDTKKYDDYWEVQPDGTKTGSSGGKTNENANLVGNDGKKNYFMNVRGRVIQSAYQRIFIKHRSPLR